MKFEFEHYGMTSQQLELLAEIVRIEAYKTRAYETSEKTNCCAVASEPEMVQPKVSSNDTVAQPEPIEEKVEEEKPKRTRRTKAEMENSAEDNTNAPTTDENNSDDSEPTPTRIEAPEAPESKITLNDLKEKAQDLVRKVDRDSVKKAINQFADKLSDVKPSDFQALMSAFNALG